MVYATNEKNRTWWKKQTDTKHCVAVVIVFAVLISTSLVTSEQETKNHANELKSEQIDQSKKGFESVCFTQGCQLAAAQILKNMDESVNPCDDFYQFACGGFIKEAEIPADKSEVSLITAIQDNLRKQLKVMFEEPPKSNELKPFTLVKKMYNICMNTTAIEHDGLTPVKKLLKEAGGWPLLEGASWNETEFDWKESMQKFRFLGLDMNGFINFRVTYGASNSTRLMIILNQAKLLIDRRSSMLGLDSKIVNAYYHYLVDLSVFFGVDRGFAEHEVRNMINFQIEIAKISVSEEQLRDVVARNNPMTITELQQRYHSVQWLDFINSIIGSEDRSVTSNETVNVAVPQYISGLLNLLSRTSKRDQANFVFFRAVYSLVKFLPDYLRKQQLEFLALATGTSILPPRWSECTDVTSRMLDVAAGAMYVRNYFHEDARQNAVQMVADIKNAFVQTIKNLDWMDEATRKIAIDKTLSMTTHIGYPDEFLDDKILENYYSKLNFHSENYLRAVAKIYLFKTDIYLDQLKDPINKTDWRQRISAITVNAGYSPQQNSIQFPAAILQGVFFNKDRPHYMNYGAIGYLIGHEVTHGFDDQGKHFDKDGNLVNWWANETDKAYMDKAKCILDQYSAITVPEVGINLNGVKAEGENIADNGGIKEAYLAYNTWVERNGAEATLPGLNFTAQQMFWISAANCWCSKSRKEHLRNLIPQDMHSPKRYRVLLPFGNADYFANDFNCPAGSKMNPTHKCQVW